MHQEFRTQIVDMSQFEDAFEIFSPEGRTYDDHVSAIRNRVVLATKAEIYPIATRYHIDVCVYTWIGRNWDKKATISSKCCRKRKTAVSKD